MAHFPPGPRVSSAIQLKRWFSTPVELMDECALRYGECFTLRFPNLPPFVFFSNPAAIKDIFTGDPDALYAGDVNRILQSIVGENSLLLLDGPRHHRERRLMMPPFHGERMRAYGEIMRRIADQNIDAWPVGQPFPVHREMQAITLDVILRTIFGLDDGPRLERMRDLIVRFTTHGTSRLGTALLLLLPPSRAVELIHIGIDPIRVGPFQLNLSRLLPWRDLVLAGDALNEALFSAIAERRKENGAEREDVLSMLLQARDDSGQPMSDVELRDEMMTLLLAGHETSATALAWTIHHLLSNPDALAAVKAEIQGIAGSGPIQPEQAAKLELLDAAIKETLRLTPIVVIVGRKLKRPMTIGGRDLPEGAVAIACIYLAHRRPDTWPEPERFRPERFLGKKLDPYEYLPFGGGARRCLGMAFATYEMKIVLAEVLSRVTLRAAPGPAVKVVRRGITFAPSGGTPVIVEGRAG